jgi:hypothetical protein
VVKSKSIVLNFPKPIQEREGEEENASFYTPLDRSLERTTIKNISTFNQKMDQRELYFSNEEEKVSHANKKSFHYKEAPKLEEFKTPLLKNE